MDKAIKPYAQVKEMLGKASIPWEKLTGYIRFKYIMDEVWDEGKPTNKHYNNLRFRRGGKTLITLCIRDGYFIACIVLGKDEREKFDEEREQFSAEVCKIYDETHTYHDGKWLGFDIYDELFIDDIIRLLHIKRKPNRKIMPESIEKCGCLDIGLSHEEITKRLITSL
ncbi:MAG: DUF3788 domain-containing protein [Defluviitaleaceae bacterium]|nr:DUF3788 domain-containing protein [Defluviitaleaceae bacterium]